jgi:hypothetical protein
MHKLAATASLVALAGAIAGCGGTAESPVSPPAQLERGAHGGAGRIVLTTDGAGRIGLQTASIRRAGRSVTIPASAVIYDPSGRTFAFVAVGRSTYSEVPVTVAHIDGGTAYLLRGPRAGAQVVSTGAEELYGVQTGVLGQT